LRALILCTNMKFIVCTSPEGGGRRELCTEIQIRLTSQRYNILTDDVLDNPVQHMAQAAYVYEHVLDYLIIKLIGPNAIKVLETIYQAYPNAVYVLTDRTNSDARNFKAIGKSKDVTKVEQQVVDMNTFMTAHGMTWTTASIPSFDNDLNIITGNPGATRLVAVLGTLNGS